MGLFGGGNKQTTTTNLTTTNISDDSTSVVQDSFNQITSITNDVTQSFGQNAFGQTVSQPIAILANGSDGGGFDANKFFDSANSVAGSDSSADASSSVKGLVGLLVIALVGLLVYRYVKRKK